MGYEKEFGFVCKLGEKWIATWLPSNLCGGDGDYSNLTFMGYHSCLMEVKGGSSTL